MLKQETSVRQEKKNTEKVKMKLPRMKKDIHNAGQMVRVQNTHSHHNSARTENKKNDQKPATGKSQNRIFKWPIKI